MKHKDSLDDLELKYKKLKKNVEKLDVGDVKGSLIVLVSNDKIYFQHSYYEDGKRKRKYISKTDIQLAKNLAQKDYNKDANFAIDLILGQIEDLKSSIEKFNLEKIFYNIREEIQPLVTKAEPTWSEIVESWENLEYTPNPFEITKPIYTKKGEAVRSKSERLIADILFEKDILYKYEYSVILKNGKTVYPDFLLFTKSRKSIFWEHFGKMDEQFYADSAIEKMEAYRETGIRNIIYTFETINHPLNQNTIYDILKEYNLD